MARFPGRLAASAARCSDAGVLRLGGTGWWCEGRKVDVDVRVWAFRRQRAGVGFCGKNLPMKLSR
jgi:hypothetical protein